MSNITEIPNIAQRYLEALFRTNLGAFGEKCFALLQPGRPFLHNWHIAALAYVLGRVRRGDLKRLVINLPPRMGKTLWSSVILPAFLHGLDPTLRIICVSYSGDLAAKHARDYRAIIMSAWYRALFPGTRIDPAKNSESEIALVGGGFRLATSVLGTLTGRGGDLIIIDDSMRADDALSDAKRRTPIDWFDGTLLSRLDNKADGAIIIVEQRLHEEDLTSHVLAKGGWEHLALAAIAEQDEFIPIGHGQVHHRRAGEALHPERESVPVLERLRVEMGTLRFAAQYQQNPIPVDGNLIKWSWFGIYDTPPERQPRDRVVQSWDPASAPGAKSDFSVCTTWLMRGKQHHLLHVLRVQVDYPTLRKLVASHRDKWDADFVLMENTAHGKALIQDFKADREVRNLTEINPKDGKEVRMSACSAMIEAGDVYIPESAPWLDPLRVEVLQFPGGRYDDQVDSISQYLNWTKRRRRRRQPGIGSIVSHSTVADWFSDDETGPQFYTPKNGYDDW